MCVHMWQHDKTLKNPVMCLHGPRFLMAWNIHVSCNLSCATWNSHVWSIRIVATHAIAMNGTRVGTNVQITLFTSN